MGATQAKAFNLLPQTFLLPSEYVPFVECFTKCKDIEGSKNIWIMKPSASSRGRGISLVTDYSDISYAEPMIIQKYVKNPLLLDGYKFDLRIYVLVTKIIPLEVFIYKEGFARLSTEKYTLDDEQLKNVMVHLTNYSIQKKNCQKEEDLNNFEKLPDIQNTTGSKLTLKELISKLDRMGINFESIWTQVCQIVIKTLYAAQNDFKALPNSFELFGYDILIDSD